MMVLYNLLCLIKVLLVRFREDAEVLNISGVRPNAVLRLLEMLFFSFLFRYFLQLFIWSTVNPRWLSKENMRNEGNPTGMASQRNMPDI